MPFSTEAIKLFILGKLLPPLEGALVTWLLTSVHFLSIFHFSREAVAKVVTEVGVWGVSTAFAWLGTHHWLKGAYSK